MTPKKRMAPKRGLASARPKPPTSAKWLALTDAKVTAFDQAIAFGAAQSSVSYTTQPALAPRPLRERAALPRVLSFANQGLRAIVEATPALSKQLDRLLGEVTFTVTARTRSGSSLQQHRGRIEELPQKEFDGLRPADKAVARATEHLGALGFTVLRVGRFGISVRGPAELVADVIGSGLQVMAQPSVQQTRSMAPSMMSAAGSTPLPGQLFVMPSESLSMSARISDDLDSFLFTPPPIYFAPPTPTPPTVPWSAVGRDEIRAGLNVPAGAPTGAQVRVGIVDTGFFPHPYYAPFSIDRLPVPTSGSPSVDANGHGTAILFNLVSVAPGAEIKAFAQSNPPQDALEVAFDDHGCRVISCSWGWDREQVSTVLEATIRDLASEDAVLLFAAGNGHYAWPGSMPEVLSIGGVFYDPIGTTITASNYASGFRSTRYPDRIVPDVCGLCGEIPRGIYILMPTQPGCTMDRENGGAPFSPRGDGDDTTKTDGWVGASGTSSATPQVAGVVAMMLEAASTKGLTLRTSDIRTLLAETCRPVTTGRNALGVLASSTVPNAATGHGLVDVTALLTRMKQLGLA
jgi:serine protease AprX